MKQVAAFIISLVVVYAAAAIGGIGSANAPVFYRELSLPAFAPPAWWFGPVWTTLYTLMGIGAYLIWRRREQAGAQRALQIFAVQLVLNVLWSWIFFAWYQGALAFVEILLLLAAIVAMLVSFWRVNKVAALLQIPYLLWVSFATLLSFQIWQLNPGVL